MSKTDPVAADLADNLAQLMAPTPEGGERRISMPIYKGGRNSRVAMPVAEAIVHFLRTNGHMPPLTKPAKSKKSTKPKEQS